MSRASLQREQLPHACWQPMKVHLPVKACRNLRHSNTAHRTSLRQVVRPLKCTDSSHRAVNCSINVESAPEPVVQAKKTAGNALGRLYVALLPGRNHFHPCDILKRCKKPAFCNVNILEGRPAHHLVSALPLEVCCGKYIRQTCIASQHS